MIAALRSGPAVERRIALAVAAVEAVLAAATALFAGMLVWTLVSPASVAPPVGVSRPAASTASAPSAARDRSVLWRANPFGAAAGDEPVMEQDAPETTLNLTLYGVVAGVDGAPGSAVIRTPDNRQGAYRQGQEIISGVTLERVLADRVIIRRAGVAETLYFEGGPRPAGPALAPPSMDQLYEAARFGPATRQGRIFGFRIERARDADLLARAGLQEGDILIRLAGQDLTNTSEFADLFEDLEDADSVDVVIDRNGAQIPLTIAFGRQ